MAIYKMPSRPSIPRGTPSIPTVRREPAPPQYVTVEVPLTPQQQNAINNMNKLIDILNKTQPEQIRSILQRRIDDIKRSLEKQGITITITETKATTYQGPGGYVPLSVKEPQIIEATPRDRGLAGVIYAGTPPNIILKRAETSKNLITFEVYNRATKIWDTLQFDNQEHAYAYKNADNFLKSIERGNIVETVAQRFRDLFITGDLQTTLSWQSYIDLYNNNKKYPNDPRYSDKILQSAREKALERLTGSKYQEIKTKQEGPLGAAKYIAGSPAFVLGSSIAATPVLGAAWKAKGAAGLIARGALKTALPIGLSTTGIQILKTPSETPNILYSWTPALLGGAIGAKIFKPKITTMKTSKITEPTRVETAARMEPYKPRTYTFEPPPSSRVSAAKRLNYEAPTFKDTYKPSLKYKPVLKPEHISQMITAVQERPLSIGYEPTVSSRITKAQQIIARGTKFGFGGGHQLLELIQRKVEPLVEIPEEAWPILEYKAELLKPVKITKSSRLQKFLSLTQMQKPIFIIPKFKQFDLSIKTKKYKPIITNQKLITSTKQMQTQLQIQIQLKKQQQQLQLQTQLQMQTTKLKQTQLQKQKLQLLTLEELQQLKKEKKKLLIPIITTTKEEKKKAFSKSFNVLVKKDATKKDKRCWLTIGTQLPIQEALSIGGQATDQTVSRSFKVIPSNKPPKSKGYTGWNDISYKFRSPKKKIPGTYIEKTQYAIDTPGEFKGITVKGWMAKRYKPKMVRL